MPEWTLCASEISYAHPAAGSKPDHRIPRSGVSGKPWEYTVRQVTKPVTDAYQAVTSAVREVADAATARELAERKERASLLQRAYIPVIQFATSRKLVTVGIGIVIFLGTGGLATGLPTNFFDQSGQTSFTVNQTLPVGTSLTGTDKATQKVEEILADTGGITATRPRSVAVAARSGGAAAPPTRQRPVDQYPEDRGRPRPPGRGQVRPHRHGGRPGGRGGAARHPARPGRRRRRNPRRRPQARSGPDRPRPGQGAADQFGLRHGHPRPGGVGQGGWRPGPVALGIEGSGGFISQPLAIVVIGGLVSSTLLTLVLVPTLYTMVEEWSERRAARAAASPAAR
jgi:hypothetical protein